MTVLCKKEINQHPKCVNCGEGHPANYRGCIVAKELHKLRKKNQSSTISDRSNVEKKTIPQQKEKSCNVKNNKNPTYASVAASASKQQEKSNEESNDNAILQLILTKITNLEGSFITINERVKKLESSNNKTASKKRKK